MPRKSAARAHSDVSAISVEEDDADDVESPTTTLQQQGPDARGVSGESAAPAPHVCDVCQRLFKFKHTLAAHRRVHSKADAGGSPSRSSATAAAGRGSAEKGAPQRRARESVGAGGGERSPAADKTTGGKTFRCSECQKELSSNQGLKSHFLIHTGEKPFECSHCFKTFRRAGTLRNHKQTHTGEKPFQCSRCPKKFSLKSSLSIHDRTHTGERPFQCSRCPKKFSFKSSLSIHERTHTGERPFQCSRCPKKFSLKSNLSTHERTHTGEKPFQRSRCPKKFSFKSNLSNHVRIHTAEERPYECSHCPKNFTDCASLMAHEQTHTRDKSFACFYCPFQSTNLSVLNGHLWKKHAAEEFYRCSQFLKMSSRETALPEQNQTLQNEESTSPSGVCPTDRIVQARDFISEKPFECSQCSRRFSTESSLAWHMTTHTGDKTNECYDSLLNQSDNTQAELQEDDEQVHICDVEMEVQTPTHEPQIQSHGLVRHLNAPEHVLHVQFLEDVKLPADVLPVDSPDSATHVQLQDVTHVQLHEDVTHVELHEDLTHVQLQEDVTHVQLQEDVTHVQLQEDDTHLRLQEGGLPVQLQEAVTHVQPQENVTHVQLQEHVTHMLLQDEATHMHHHDVAHADQAQQQLDEGEDSSGEVADGTVQGPSDSADLQAQASFHAGEEPPATPPSPPCFTSGDPPGPDEETRKKVGEAAALTVLEATNLSKNDHVGSRFPRKPNVKRRSLAGRRTQLSYSTVHSCSLCPEKFGDRDSLKCHRGTHASPKTRPHECPHCTRLFSSALRLKVHLRSHSGWASNECSLCWQTFPSRAELKEHARTHVAGKPFKCNHCAKRFAIKAYLRDHQRAHSK